MGRMQGNTIVVGGRTSYYFQDYSVWSQNEDGNYSTIGWNAQYYFDRCDAQLDNGVANLSGTRWYNGGRCYNYAANFTVHAVMLAQSSFNIGHDYNGNCLMNINGGIDVYQSGRSSGNKDEWLPALYQGIVCNYITFSNITDVGFTVNVNVDRWANLLQLNINGSGWVTYYDGGWGTLSVNVGGPSKPLRSGYGNTVSVLVRRASNNHTATYGAYTVTTSKQNGFFDLGEF